MLGAVKGDGTAQGVPLFRVLARRWKSLAPVRRRRIALASMLPANEQPEPARKWISKPRIVAIATPAAGKASRPSWNPWLWMK